MTSLRDLQVPSGTTQHRRPSCPHCGSSYTIKHGKSGNHRRFQCKACSKTYVETKLTQLATTTAIAVLERITLPETAEWFVRSVSTRVKVFQRGYSDNIEVERAAFNDMLAIIPLNLDGSDTEFNHYQVYYLDRHYAYEMFVHHCRKLVSKKARAELDTPNAGVVELKPVQQAS